MNVFVGLLINILEEGLIYGIMAMGVYITYSVLSFPDLSVDGTFPLGCCVTAALASLGVHPLVCLLAACVVPPVLCGAAGLAPLAAAAGYCLAVWRGFRQLDGMSGDISGFGLTLGELAGAAVLCLVR